MIYYHQLAICFLTWSSLVAQAQEVETLFIFPQETRNAPNPDGLHPHDGLVLGPDGNFYGTAHGGGVMANGYGGDGTLFRLTPGGVVTRLHTFNAVPAERLGFAPVGGLIVGRDGFLYGTTSVHGSAIGASAIFRTTLDGKVTYLATVENYESPQAKLVQGRDGHFYGTTAGFGSDGSGAGLVFKMTIGGNLTILHKFDGENGSAPGGALVQGKDGYFYGVTKGGSGDLFHGTIYRIAPDGAFRQLLAFDYKGGSAPRGGVIEGPEGSFYGTASNGGAHGNGALFKISPQGDYTRMALT